MVYSRVAFEKPEQVTLFLSQSNASERICQPQHPAVHSADYEQILTR